MIKIFAGPAGTEKSSLIFKEIVSSAENKRKVCVIVPDQFTYEYDRLLYKALGARLFNSIKVTGFSRLSEEIIKSHGNLAREYADENAKLIMMYLAVKKFKSEKKSVYYRRQLDKNGFFSDALRLVTDLRHYSVAPADLEVASLDVASNLLKDKLFDIGGVYSNYLEMLEMRELKDSITDISEATQISRQVSCFKGCDIFIDKFNSFTFDENEMISEIIKQAKNVFFSLTTSSENNPITKLSPFDNSVRTQTDIVNYATRSGKKTEIVECKSFDYYKSEAILNINKNIFGKENSSFNNDGSVKVISSPDMYEEIEYVASEIKKLICDQGYHYSDIAVISRDVNSYFSVINSVFGRYEIPFYIDSKQPVNSKSLIIFINTIFEAVKTRCFDTEAILRYIKSPFSRFSFLNCSMLEDYCYQWNVKGDMWLSEFTACSENDERLKKINEFKEKVITPLKEFKNTQHDTATSFCERFLNLLEEIDLHNRIHYIVKKSLIGKIDPPAESIEAGREFKQLWGILMSAVSSIYKHIGDDELSVKEFCDLLSSMLSQTSIANPPQKLDAVTVAGAERSVVSDKKAVFIIGTNDGKFPQTVRENGFFTEYDLEQLDKVGLDIAKPLMWRLSEERLAAYLALSLPSEFLYVLYPNSDLSGKSLRPSVIVKQIISMFGKSTLITSQNLGIGFYSKTLGASFNKLTENYREKSAEVLAIKKLLCESPEYKHKINYIESASNEKSYNIKQSTSRNLFFEKGLDASATKVEEYYKCPFMFFCKYGLKLRPVKTVDVNPLSRGNVVHYCLEKILSKKTEDNKRVYNSEFERTSDGNLLCEIRANMAEYLENELGGKFGKTVRFNELYSNLAYMIFEILNNIKEEFKNSDFRPVAFEYNLKSKEGSVFEITLDDGIRIRLFGKIDRIDTYENGGKKYIRIIDYKTGNKDFLFEEIYNGLNLQMLLYLTAVTNPSENTAFSNFIPSGIFYMPANYLNIDIPRKLDLDNNSDNSNEKEINTAKAKFFRMKGLVTDIEESIKAMEEEVGGKFIPVKKLKGGGYDKKSKLISQNSFNKLCEFSVDKVKSMVESLKTGQIDAVPVGNNLTSSCDYCEYWSICGKTKNEKMKIVNKLDAKELKEIIGMNEQEGDSDVD